MTLNSTISPILIFIAFILYGWVHSLTASPKMKAWANKVFGEFGELYYRIFYNLFALISILPVLAMVYLLPDKPFYSLSAPWAKIFNLLQFLSLALLGLSVLQTGLKQFFGLSQALGVKGDGQLIITGLYKYMRHPIYTFTNTLFWFSATVSQNKVVFYIAITLYTVIGAFYEELKLVKEYGQAYRDYQASTPMMIPFLYRKKIKKN